MTFSEYLRAVADKIEEAENNGNLLEVRRLLGLCGNACLEEKLGRDTDGINYE